MLAKKIISWLYTQKWKVSLAMKSKFWSGGAQHLPLRPVAGMLREVHSAQPKSACSYAPLMIKTINDIIALLALSSIRSKSFFDL